MSDKNPTNPAVDTIVEEIVDLAGSWLQAGLGIGKAAMAATAESLKATSDSLARFADSLDD